MTTSTQTHTLLDIERRFWDAMQEKDGKSAALTDDSCIVVGAQGVNAISPDEMESMTREGPWQLERYVLQDDTAQVRMIGDDVALVAYSVNEDITLDGKPMSVDAHEASVWVRRDGEWRCAMHVESVAGDPFGRKSDREKSGRESGKLIEETLARRAPRRQREACAGRYSWAKAAVWPPSRSPRAHRSCLPCRSF